MMRKVSPFGARIGQLRARTQRLGSVRDGVNHERTLSIDEGTRQQVVWQHRRGDLRDVRKHLPDIQHGGDRAQQLVGRVQTPLPLAFDDQGLLQGGVVERIIDRERDLVGDQRQEGDVLRVVDMASRVTGQQHPDAPAGRGQRQRTG